MKPIGKPFKPSETVSLSGNSELYGCTFNRTQLLTLQYSKLVNYHCDLLSPEWGGRWYMSGNYGEVISGFERFSKDVGIDQPALPPWISRLDESEAWGPGNFKLSHKSDPKLGQRYEAYLAIEGAIVRCRDAARFLMVDIKTILDLKLKLLVDSAVIAGLILKTLDPKFTENRVIVPQSYRERKSA